VGAITRITEQENGTDMAGLGLDPQLLQRITTRIEILVRESQNLELEPAKQAF
jgi:hypothetical protein